MRVSKEAMAQSHREIVRQAGQMLRLRGVQGTSVADLMQACGLTHGGFYRHFASKDALVAEATEAVVNEILGHFEEIARNRGPQAALDAYIKRYLSEEHVLKPDMGCPVAAYAAELAREAPAARQALTNGIERIHRLISAGLMGPVAQRKSAARAVFAMLVGAVVTARSTGDAADMRCTLQAARLAVGRLLPT
jgi:TetR/AcrR family transcriptional regulator, transcriptional repressor for nem operon